MGLIRVLWYRRIGRDPFHVPFPSFCLVVLSTLSCRYTFQRRSMQSGFAWVFAMCLHDANTVWVFWKIFSGLSIWTPSGIIKHCCIYWRCTFCCHTRLVLDSVANLVSLQGLVCLLVSAWCSWVKNCSRSPSLVTRNNSLESTNTLKYSDFFLLLWLGLDWWRVNRSGLFLGSISVTAFMPISKSFMQNKNVCTTVLPRAKWVKPSSKFLQHTAASITSLVSMTSGPWLPCKNGFSMYSSTVTCVLTSVWQDICNPGSWWNHDEDIQCPSVVMLPVPPSLQQPWQSRATPPSSVLVFRVYLSARLLHQNIYHVIVFLVAVVKRYCRKLLLFLLFCALQRFHPRILPGHLGACPWGSACHGCVQKAIWSSCMI